MENYKNQIMDYIADTDSNVFKICKKAYTVLTEANSTDILRFFFEKIDFYVREYNPPLDEEEQKLILEWEKKYGSLLDELLTAHFNERYCEDDFYDKLWKNIIQLPLFETCENREIILWILSMNSCIPYYKPNVLHSMPDEEYRQRSEQLSDSIICARSVIFQNFKGNTEQSSALLELLDRCKDEPEKEVFLSHTISLIKDYQRQNTLDQIKQELLKTVKKANELE